MLEQSVLYDIFILDTNVMDGKNGASLKHLYISYIIHCLRHKSRWKCIDALLLETRHRYLGDEGWWFRHACLSSPGMYSSSMSSTKWQRWTEIGVTPFVPTSMPSPLTYRLETIKRYSSPNDHNHLALKHVAWKISISSGTWSVMSTRILTLRLSRIFLDDMYSAPCSAAR